METQHIDWALEYERTAGRVYTGHVVISKQKGGGYTPDFGTGRRVCEFEFSCYELKRCIPFSSATKAERASIVHFATKHKVPSSL